MEIRVDNLRKSIGDLEILRSISLSIPEKKIAVILGPSGCGKTTFLHLLSGTTPPDGGEISGLEGKNISYVFQEPRLIPWMSVEKNCRYVLPEKIDEENRQKRIKRVLDLVGLTEFAAYYPHQLSGGMRQRASMARAFAYPSDILLMDEPFQALDIRLKLSLIVSFTSIWREMSRTVLFVTHNIQEALLLGDELFVFSTLPAVVKEHLHNDIPREERKLGDERLFPLEKELYRVMTEGSLPEEKL